MPVAIANFTNDIHEDQGAALDDGPSVRRVLIRRTYRGGLLGTAVVELQTCITGQTAFGYAGVEVFEGALGERMGGFAFVHIGRRQGDALDTIGYVVPGSGSGDLAGISGEIAIRIADTGHDFGLTYTLPDDRPGA